MIHKLRTFLFLFSVSMIVAPFLALAQSTDPSTADVAGALGAIWPGLSKYLALVVPIQMVAKLIAPLPGRIGGYTHGTIWSRFWDTVAAFPGAPAPRPAPVVTPSTDLAGDPIRGG